MAQSTCTTCHAPLPDAARFCPACGAAVAGRGHGEERKVVTALFADVVDSTARAEKLDPEDVRAVLVPYFERVRAELERFGGTVEKFIGDAVVALFGAPAAHDDDPERAVRAAFAIREVVRDLNERDARLGLQVRVGIATGEALVALSASPAHGEGMASGDVTNTASRLQEAAGAGGILVDAVTARATFGVFDYGPPEHVAAKGKSEPVEAWRPTAILEALAGSRRHESPLVGRGPELTLLLDVIERSRRRRTAELVTVVGVPGIGKSRLVAEVRNALGDTAAFSYGRSLPYGDAGAFSALGEIVKEIAGILKTDSSEEARRKLVAAVEGAVPDDAPWIEARLRPLVGLAGQPGGDRREESFLAWRRFFEGLADRKPHVVVIEDLHWADDGLLDFVVALFEGVAEVPLVILCTARPELLERRHDWSGGVRNATTTTLRALSSDETAELLQALLGGPDALDAAGRMELVTRSGGNPLYAEEYVRTIRERGLVGDGGRVPLPETVHGLIAARIDGLPDLEKRVLRSAAVVGRTFWGSIVVDAMGEDRRVVEDALSGLERKEFILRARGSTVAGEREYRFRHVLVRDVAYAQVPRGPRAALHETTAEWLRGLSEDRGDQIERAGVHYLRALDLATAAGTTLVDVAAGRRALREAGERASTLASFVAATQFLDAELSLTPVDDPARGGLLLAAGRAHFHADGGGVDQLRAASAAALELGEHEIAAEAEATLAVLAMRRGDAEQAFADAERALSLVGEGDPSPAKAQVLASVAGLMMMAGRNSDAVMIGRDALSIAATEALPGLEAHALTTVGVARALAGDPAGTEDVERAVEVAEAAGSAETIRAYSNLASVLAVQGELERSAATAERAWAAAERFGNPGVIRFLESERCATAYWFGDWDEAVRIADTFESLARAGSPHYGERLCRQVRAAVRLARGDTRGADDDSIASLDSARAMDDFQNLLPALALRARVLAETDRADEAAETLAEALDVWRERGRDELVSFWTFDLALAAGADAEAEVRRLADRAGLRTRWADAALALLDDRFEDAADVYEQIGARPERALALLVAAERRGHDDHASVEALLEPAIAFLRRVGAAAYLRRSEAVLVAA